MNQTTKIMKSTKSQIGLPHKSTLRKPLWYVASAMTPRANIQTMLAFYTEWRFDFVRGIGLYV